MSQNGSEPRACGTGLAENNVQEDGRPGSPNRATRRHPVATGAFYPPTGRRTLGVVVVRTCPAANCRQMHLHRAETVASAHMAERVGSCGATYLLNVHHAITLGGSA